MKKGIDYIGTGVGGVVLRQDGKLFLSKRGAQVRNEHGKWEFPGGGIRFGERSRDGAERELLEEYSLMVKAEVLLGVCDHILVDEGQHWLSPSYLCRYLDGVPVINEPHKCDDIGWFTLNEILEKDISVAAKYVVEQLKLRFIDDTGLQEQAQRMYATEPELHQEVVMTQKLER